MRRHAALLALVALAVPVAAAAPAAVAAASSATVGVVTKAHGVRLADGRQGVRLVVPVDTRGLVGKTVATAIFFEDASGAALAAADRGYAGPDGTLRVVSRDTVVATDPEALGFAYGVPYAAFPRRSAPYQVVGRVRVFERVGNGRALLATGTVTFWVGA